MKSAMLSSGLFVIGGVVVTILLLGRDKSPDKNAASERLAVKLLETNAMSAIGNVDDPDYLKSAKEVILKQRSGGGIDINSVFNILQELRDSPGSQDKTENFIDFLIGLAIQENGEVDRIYSFEDYVKFLEFLNAGSKKNGLEDYLFTAYSTENDIDGLRSLVEEAADDRRVVQLTSHVIDRFFSNTTEDSVSKVFEFIDAVGMTKESRDAIISSYAQNLQGWLRSTDNPTEQVPLNLLKESLTEFEHWGPISAIYGGRELERGDLEAFNVTFSGNPYGMDRYISSAVSEAREISLETAEELRHLVSLESAEGVFAVRKILGKLKDSVSVEEYDRFVGRQFSKEELAKLQPSN